MEIHSTKAVEDNNSPVSSILGHDYGDTSHPAGSFYTPSSTTEMSQDIDWQIMVSPIMAFEPYGFYMEHIMLQRDGNKIPDIFEA